MDPAFADPADAGRRAQLLLALLLLSIFPIFWLSIPIQTHAVKLDLPPLPERIVAMAPAPPAYLMTSYLVPDLELEPARGLHELVLTPGDAVLLNKREVDLAGLRARLDVIAVRNEWVDFRPEPNTRYEFFAEVLAVTRRARLERLRLDNRPFGEALDEPPAITGAKARPPKALKPESRSRVRIISPWSLTRNSP